MDLELMRQQWSDGDRRVEAARSEPARHARLTGQVDLMMGELRRRVGRPFTLDDLGRVYERTDDWALLVLADALPEDAPPPEAATVADAAFHRYARGALDYAP
jgi:hypothetical protein